MAKPILNKAFSVGLLTAVAGTVFVLAFTFFKKGGYSSSNSYRVYALFDDATGLTWKSRVQVAGIQIGEVEAVRLQGSKARLELRISKDVDLHTDACLTKRFPSALLSDALLDATLGSSTAPLLRSLPEDQREITCVSEGVSVQRLLDSLQKISGNIQSLSGELAATIGGSQGSIKQIIENLARISQNLDRTVAANMGKVDQILSNAQEFTGTLASLAARDKERYHEIAENVAEASARLNDVLASLQGILGSGETKANAKQAVATVREALDKLNSSLADIQKTTHMIAEGKGVAGKLLTDERLGDKVSSSLEGLTNYFDRAMKLQLQVELRSEWLLSQRGAKTYAGLKLIPTPDKYYLFEIVDDPRNLASSTTTDVVTTTSGGTTTTTQQTSQSLQEKLRVSLEFAKRFGPATFRVGVIESSGGVGTDLHLLKDRLQISLNLYQFARPDVRYPSLKLFANLYFLRYFYATVGGNDILNTWRSGHYPGGPRFAIGQDLFFGGGIYFTDDDLKTLFFTAGSAISGAASSGSLK